MILFLLMSHKIFIYVSQITGKLYNYLFFNLYLMFHACVLRFDVMGNLENFVKFVRLKKTLVRVSQVHLGWIADDVSQPRS